MLDCRASNAANSAVPRRQIRKERRRGTTRARDEASGDQTATGGIISSDEAKATEKPERWPSRSIRKPAHQKYHTTSAIDLQHATSQDLDRITIATHTTSRRQNVRPTHECNGLGGKEENN